MGEPAEPAQIGPPPKPAEDAESATPESKRAWSIELDYKKADPAIKGSWGAFIAYRFLGSYAVIAPTYDAMGAGNKGVEMGVDYVFDKNIMGTLKYFFGLNFLGGTNRMLVSLTPRIRLSFHRCGFAESFFESTRSLYL